MNLLYYYTILPSCSFPASFPIDCSIVNHCGAIRSKNTKMSEKDGIGSTYTSANDPDLRTDQVDSHHQGAPPSVSSQTIENKKATLSASSAPFVPRNSPSQQQQVGMNSLSVSSAPDQPLVSAAMPNTLLQHQANKNTLSVSTPPFDPSWRQKLERPPASAFPESTNASTSMSTKQQDCSSVRGNTAAMMMPDMHHHHRIPMMGIPGQVYNRYLNTHRYLV